MISLSQKSQELLDLLRRDYINSGYLYSGAKSFSRLQELGYGADEISELQSAGLLQKRDCDDFAFELSAEKRKRLISSYGLCSAWYEKAGKGLLLDIQHEIQNAADLHLNKETGRVSVYTLKHESDKDKPDKAEISTPFYVGQVIQVEYDLPSKLRRAGYSGSLQSAAGREVGDFMVTDLFCNTLISPHMNMLELQSLSEDFNRIHPDSRTMLLFEDVVLKRLREPAASLDDQIHTAASKTDESQHVHDLQTKEAGFEH